MTLPVAAGILELLEKNPQIFLIALVVLIGIINAVGKMAQKAVKKMKDAGDGGSAEQGLRAGRRTRAARPVEEPEPEAFVDPEELLPDFLRPAAWRQAVAAGVVEATPVAEPALEPEIQLEPLPTVEPKRKRKSERERERERRHDWNEEHATTHRLLEDSPVATVVYAAPTIHGLLGVGQPSHSEVRRAILWNEVLGPPRAMRPYQAPRAGRRAAPPAISMITQPPRSDS